LLVAGVAALLGRSQVRRASPPLQVVENVQQDIATIKEHAHR